MHVIQKNFCSARGKKTGSQRVLCVQLEHGPLFCWFFFRSLKCGRYHITQQNHFLNNIWPENLCDFINLQHQFKAWHRNFIGVGLPAPNNSFLKCSEEFTFFVFVTVSDENALGCDDRFEVNRVSHLFQSHQRRMAFPSIVSSASSGRSPATTIINLADS